MRRPPSPTKKYVTVAIKLAFLLVLYFLLSFNFVPGVSVIKDSFQSRFMTNNKLLVIGSTVITVEVVDTIESRIKGLSGRKELKPQTGMLFVFDKEGDYGIWMKDMNFPIDIIWFNKYEEIVHIYENATPESYPETFQSPKLSQYVLEVPAGFVRENFLKIGDMIDLK